MTIFQITFVPYLEVIFHITGLSRISKDGDYVKMCMEEEKYFQQASNIGIVIKENMNTDSLVPPSFKVLLSNVHPTVSESKLRTLLSPFGKFDSEFIHQKIAEVKGYSHSESGSWVVYMTLLKDKQIPTNFNVVSENVPRLINVSVEPNMKLLSTANSPDTGVAVTGKDNIMRSESKMKVRSAVSRKIKLFGKVSRQMNARPPSLQELLDANRMMYVDKIMSYEVFNYDALYYGIHLHDFDNSVDESFDDCEDESFTEERQELYYLFGTYENLIKYDSAINKLQNCYTEEAISILLDLVDDGVEPACYAYVLVFFKNILSQCDKLNITEENVKIMENNEDEIRKAVQLLRRAYRMEPACKFLLGMMKRCNIGECSKFMDGSWEDDLIYVLNVARSHGFFNIEQYILMNIDYDNRWEHKECGLGMRKKLEYLKKIGTYSLYEITLNMSSEQHYNINALNNLFGILSENNFTEALFSYGAALLQNRFGKTFTENIKEAIQYFERAYARRHIGTRFLLGTLPFNSRIAVKLTRNQITRYMGILETYINNSDDSCVMNKANVDKAAYCLVSEYYSKESYFLLQDKEKAMEILRSREMHEELSNLQSQIK